MPKPKPDRRTSSRLSKAKKAARTETSNRDKNSEETRTEPQTAHARKRGKGPKAADWAPAYLAALAETGHCKRASDAAGTSYTAVWRRRQSDPEFSRAYDEALAVASHLLEAEAVRRAFDGLRQFKFHPKTGAPLIHPETGEPYFEHAYSDTLMQLLLKRFFPKEYRDRQEVEHSGHVGMTLEEFQKRVTEANA